MNEPTVVPPAVPEEARPWSRIEVMRLDPGDIVVLRLPYEPKFAEYEQLSAHLRALFPSHKSVILTGGIELRIMREEATQ